MQNTNLYKQLSLEDLKSVHSFRLWIKESLSHLYTNKEITNTHLLIYLDYMKSVIAEAENVDKPFWLNLIRQLENKLKSLKRVEKS